MSFTITIPAYNKTINCCWKCVQLFKYRRDQLMNESKTKARPLNGTFTNPNNTTSGNSRTVPLLFSSRATPRITPRRSEFNFVTQTDVYRQQHNLTSRFNGYFNFEYSSLNIRITALFLHFYIHKQQLYQLALFSRTIWSLFRRNLPKIGNRKTRPSDGLPSLLPITMRHSSRLSGCLLFGFLRLSSNKCVSTAPIPTHSVVYTNSKPLIFGSGMNEKFK